MKKLFTDEEYNTTGFRDRLTVECSNCNQPCLKTKRSIYSAIKKYGVEARTYCNSTCAQSFKKDSHTHKVTCHLCNKEFLTYNSYNKSSSGLRFCSKICSINYWGKARLSSGSPPKHKFCICGDIKTKGSKFCRICADSHKRNHVDNQTIGQFQYRNRGATNRYTNLRDHSRRLALKAINSPACTICGYSTICEVCHIRSVANFPSDTLVSVVNALSNLTILCPNHHKELDKGLLDSDSIKSLQDIIGAH